MSGPLIKDEITARTSFFQPNFPDRVGISWIAGPVKDPVKKNLSHKVGLEYLPYDRVLSGWGIIFLRYQ